MENEQEDFPGGSHPLARGPKPASHEVSALVQDLFHKPELKQRMVSDPESVFDEYRVSEPERAAMREGSPPALARMGLHPILMIHWNMAMNPAMQGVFSIRNYSRYFDGVPAPDAGSTHEGAIQNG